MASNAANLRNSFQLDSKIDPRSDGALDYEYSTIAYKFYDAKAIPDDDEIINDLKILLETYDRYIELKNNDQQENDNQTFSREEYVSRVIKAIAESGFYFEPWQIAAYITALRTKPFVILAGVSGTGKSKLPALVAKVTGGVSKLLPVRPDWTDSSDVLVMDLKFPAGAGIAGRQTNSGTGILSVFSTK